MFVGVDGRSRYQYNWDTNNIAPRLGLSYQVDPKTVVRGGYSHIFGPSNQGAQGTVGPFGFRTENLWVTSIDGITPLNLLKNPYPNGFVPSPGSSQGLLTQAGANLQAPLQDTPSPWTRQFNVNVQRELPWAMFLEVAYVGTRGYDLSTVGEGGLSLNQLDPQYMSLGSQLNQQVPNPFFGIVNNGVLTQPTVARGQLLRPYPQFTDVIPLYASGAKSRYDALQMTGRKRLSHGLMFEGSYTYAKAREIGMSHQDSYNLDASWALASYDIKHRFVVSYLYELPFGRNRRFGSGASTLVERPHRRLAVQRHHDAAVGHAAADHREQHRGHLRRAHAAEQQRQRSAAERTGRGSAEPLLRHQRLQPAGGVHLRQRADLLAGAPHAVAAQLRPVDLQDLRDPQRHEGAVPDRGAQRVQHGAVLRPEHQRDVDVVRGDHRPGQCAAAAAVRVQAVVVRRCAA